MTAEMARVLGRVFVGAAALLVAFVLRSSTAQAYPQWQLLSGSVRCNQCHYAPAGGGLINSYGRDAAGEDLSTFGGNGALLHGALPALPSWLALGGDLRGALVANDVQDPNGPTWAAFPMQADLYARFALPVGLSIYATGGVRGQERGGADIVPDQNYQPLYVSRFISREHYLMWQPEALGPYVRAGRFFAPFGLRLAEHITYIRRDLGFNQLEESYNLSAGAVYEAWELHATLFAPDFIRHIGSDEKGLAVYFERRLLSDQLALGAQTRLASGPGVTRFILGGVGKYWLPPARTMFIAEVDVVQMLFDSDAVGTRGQLVAAAGAVVAPLRGLLLTALGERNQVDLQVRDSAWNAASLFVNWFPYAHVEVEMMGRLQFPSGGATAKTFLAQIHYYL
ncbi:MAG TPA: hypothetical protein VGL59_04170 [Polyangia bacterium]|jgi:hypothetical protein